MHASVALAVNAGADGRANTPTSDLRSSRALGLLRCLAATTTVHLRRLNHRSDDRSVKGSGGCTRSDRSDDRHSPSHGLVDVHSLEVRDELRGRRRNDLSERVDAVAEYLVSPGDGSPLTTTRGELLLHRRERDEPARDVRAIRTLLVRLVTCGVPRGVRGLDADGDGRDGDGGLDDGRAGHCVMRAEIVSFRLMTATVKKAQGLHPTPSRLAPTDGVHLPPLLPIAAPTSRSDRRRRSGLTDADQVGQRCLHHPDRAGVLTVGIDNGAASGGEGVEQLPGEGDGQAPDEELPLIGGRDERRAEVTNAGDERIERLDELRDEDPGRDFLARGVLDERDERAPSRGDLGGDPTASDLPRATMTRTDGGGTFPELLRAL